MNKDGGGGTLAAVTPPGVRKGGGGGGGVGKSAGRNINGGVGRFEVT